MIIAKRVLDEKTTTPGGYPLPLSGKALTKTPVVVRREGGCTRRRYARAGDCLVAGDD